MTPLVLLLVAGTKSPFDTLHTHRSKMLLLRLPALDRQSGGIHHETARIAGAPIAGNG